MSEEKIRKEMASAFKIWADVTPLRFYEVIEKGKPVDMEIWFSIRGKDSSQHIYHVHLIN